MFALEFAALTTHPMSDPGGLQLIGVWCGAAGRVSFCAIGYFGRSSRQTAVCCIARRRARRAPLGAGMLSDVVTARLPSRVAAANCT
jgi:hypothetical protein